MWVSGRKVLVTGANGFIGGALVKRLEAEGAQVTAWTREMGDLRDREQCDRAVWCQDAVFHFAAVTAGAGVVVANPMALVTDNLVMTANMLAAASSAKVHKFIFPSSTTGYPDIDKPMREEDYFTGTPFKGYYPIGMTKRYLETLAAMYPMTTVALRATNVYGPGDCFDPVRSHVIPATIRKVAERQNPIVVWGDGLDARDAIYIDDMTRACVLSADLIPGHHAFNLGLGKSYTIREILSVLLSYEGYRPKIEYDISKPQLLRKREVTTDYTEMCLGWTYHITMEEGLKRTLAWYKENALARV